MISVEEIELFTSLSDGKYLNSTEIARMEKCMKRTFMSNLLLNESAN